MSAKEFFIPGNRSAFCIAGLMFVASILSVAARPATRLSDARPASLESIVPKQFGEWREVPVMQVQVVNPQTKELLDRLYSEILTRVYENGSGYRIMISLAYGSDQRGSLQAHKPEVCYPAQGFVVKTNEPGTLATEFGDIPVRRLSTSLGARHEPLTYWFTVGDNATGSYWQRRFLQLSFGLTGRIPDGMIFRVSSIDPQPPRAYKFQEQFVNQLLQAAAPADRRRLSGLGAM